MFKFTNPNPAGQLVGDCVIRALSVATKMDWETVFMRVCLQGYLMNDMPSSNAVWEPILGRSVIEDTQFQMNVRIAIKLAIFVSTIRKEHL